MASELSREDLTRLTRLGATTRLEELRQEEAAIRSAFPDLFNASPGRPRATRKASASQPAQESAPETPTRRRRGGMSAAGRKAVSERMRRYWAERRKSKRG